MTIEHDEKVSAEEQQPENLENVAAGQAGMKMTTDDPQIMAMMESLCGWHLNAMQELDNTARGVRDNPQALALAKPNPDDPEGEPIPIETSADHAAGFIMGIFAARKLFEAFPLQYRALQADDPELQAHLAAKAAVQQAIDDTNENPT